ncbi:MAG TPA: putative metal-dependent hydrolase [Spirochaetia bacterium]|nr:putative metal-dependent hydrolase [Spirochaetia bacterium]
MSDEIRFPVGTFAYREPSVPLRRQCIAEFREAPGLLRQAVTGLSDAQLAQRYRPDGWTLAQVVHHLAESDANAYPRLKYALTESAPPSVMVAPQELWAELPDARSAQIDGSLAMFEGIRRRWAEAWESLSDKDYHRQWRHTWFGLVTVDFLLQQYAWHARHHTAQITACRGRLGW